MMMPYLPQSHLGNGQRSDWLACGSITIVRSAYVVAIAGRAVSVDPSAQSPLQKKGTSAGSSALPVRLFDRLTFRRLRVVSA